MTIYIFPGSEIGESEDLHSESCCIQVAPGQTPVGSQTVSVSRSNTAASSAGIVSLTPTKVDAHSKSGIGDVPGSTHEAITGSCQPSAVTSAAATTTGKQIFILLSFFTYRYHDRVRQET